MVRMKKGQKVKVIGRCRNGHRLTYRIVIGCINKNCKYWWVRELSNFGRYMIKKNLDTDKRNQELQQSK